MQSQNTMAQDNLVSYLFSLRKYGFIDHAVRTPLIKILLYRFFKGMLAHRSPIGNLLAAHARSRIRTWKNLPPRILIEPSSLCNASCETCPRQYFEREKGVMGPELFRSILGQVKALNIQLIILTGFGEPLMDKGFLEKIEEAGACRLKVTFFTNATLLDEKAARNLLAMTHLEQINLSVGGENFYEYCRERRYASTEINETAFRNIQQLCKLRVEMSSPVQINIQPVYPPENLLKSIRIHRFWRSLHPDSVDGNIRHSFAFKEMGITGGHYGYIPCKLLWDALLITSSGRVAMCCEDVNAREMIGDLTTEPLSQVLKGERLNQLRSLHLQGRRSEIEICRNCDIFSFWY